MEEKEEIDLKLTCMSCLCVGRTLRNITEEKCKQFYFDCLDDVSLCITIQDVHVCWECEALLRKIVWFRKQVQDSYRTIQTQLTENSHVYISSDKLRQPHFVNKTLPLSYNVKDEGLNEGDPIVNSNNKDAIDVEIETLLSKADRTKKKNGLQNLERCPLSGDVSPSYHNTAIVTVNTLAYDVKVEGGINESDSTLNTNNEDALDVEIETLVSKADKNKKKNGLQNLDRCPLSGDLSSSFHNSTVTVDALSYDVKVEGVRQTRRHRARLSRDQQKNQAREERKKVRQTRRHRARLSRDQQKNQAREERKKDSSNECKSPEMALDSDNVDPFEEEIEPIASKEKKSKKRIKSKIKKAQKVVKKINHAVKTKKAKKLDDKVITIELSYEEMLLERDREAKKDSYINSPFKCETCIIGFNYKNSYKAHVSAKHSKSYEEMLLERDKEAKKDSYINSPFKCESCIFGFNYKNSYKAHVSAKHSKDGGDYECPICKSTIQSVDSFTAHYKRHLRRFECSLCQKRTMDMKVMEQHYYSTHDIPLKEYKCDVCGKISNSIDTHRYHKDTHKARVQCTECDKTFTHRAGLMNHRITVHELKNRFPCTVCDKVFRWKTSLRRHLEKHDVKEKCSAAYCSVCGVTFASVCSYQRHMRNSLRHVHPDQLKFICDHCKRRFVDKTKLRDHIEEKHLHRTFQCHICMKTSKNRVGLDQHIRNVHKGRPHNKLCHHCGKAFPTKVQLESHIRAHTGERPFACDFCPTTFSQLSNLYKHSRQVHSNIKAKRYPPNKKRKEDKPPDPHPDPPPDPYRPVAVLHYNTERGFVM